MEHIGFFVIILSIIFVDSRLSKCDLIKLLIVFLICSSDSQFNQDKVEHDNIQRDTKIKINDDYKNKEEPTIKQNTMLKINNNINDNISDNINNNNKEKLIVYSSEKEEKKNSNNKRELGNKEKEKIKLSDIIRKRYKGVNITLSLVNSDILSGEVISVFKGIIIIKSNNITYYIDQDFVVSFH